MKTAALALPCAAIVMLIGHVDALPSYVPRIPNGANVPNVPALGHSDHTGASGDLDAFGEAFEKAGDKWTLELCKADSDGDGQTNGEELGDPCCEWTVGGKPTFTSGVSNPGDASSKVRASVLGSHKCSRSATPSGTTTKAPNGTNSSSPSTSASSDSTSSSSATPSMTSGTSPVVAALTLTPVAFVVVVALA